MQLSYHLCHHIIYGYQFASYHVDTEMVICDTYQWDEKHILQHFLFIFIKIVNEPVNQIMFCEITKKCNENDNFFFSKSNGVTSNI